MEHFSMGSRVKANSVAKDPTGHMNQLDSVRTIAVGMVIVSHWTPNVKTIWFGGNFGVQLFFVISGFLITGILLDARRKAEQFAFPRSAVLKTFYVRRFLRIFPLFYATLAVTFLLGFHEVREYIWWLIPYLGNVLMALRGSWLGVVSPFWSLSVEEQFYLVWPVLILFVSKRLILPLIVSVIAFAEVFRLVCFTHGINGVTTAVLLFGSLDTLGLGAILALLLRKDAGRREGKTLIILHIASIAGCFGYFALGIAGLFKEFPALLYWLSTVMMAFTGLGIVWLAARGVGGPIGWFMELAPMVYLGRISYGLYIFHNFIPPGVSGLCRFLGLPNVEVHTYRVFPLNLCILVGLASISWHFFEKRINDLKRFFPYVSKPSTDVNSFPGQKSR
jgi:peptidoglycan/LPS O-acetylase OafA/YrhL